MATEAFKIQELQYATEASFLEYATVPASLTYSTRIPVISIDSGRPEQDRQGDQALQSRQNESAPGYLLPRAGGAFEFTVPWSGHVTTTVAGLTEHWLQDLLSDGLGGGITAGVGGTIASATDADTFVTAGCTLTAGQIIRVGARGDARGDGQAGVVDTWAAQATQLLTALPAAPASPDVVYATQLAYPAEALAAGTSKRFFHGFGKATQQYHYLGCHLDGITFNIPIGGLPTLKLRYRYAYWVRATVAVPTAVAMGSCKAVPIAGGSVMVQTVGTTTRALVNPAEIQLTLDLGLAAQEGPASGQPDYGHINGWQRTHCVPTLSMLIPHPGATTYDALYDADGSSTTHQHILATLSCQDGAALGFYMPRAYLVGPRPTHEEHNGLIYTRLTWRGREGTTITNDLTRSAIRLFGG